MLRFSKYSGAGNDFVLVDADRERLVDADALARRLCARTTGVGVDGLIPVRRLGDGRFEVRFFNPDGSEISTCGNGTRCAARFALDRGMANGGPFVLVTPAAEVHVETLTDGGIALEYRIEARVRRELEVEFAGARYTGWLVALGVPHFVLPVDRLPEGPIEEDCGAIRRLPDLAPDGANVNVVALMDRERGAIRTFERGIEGETLACGSGSMASVLALHAAGRCERRVSLRTWSGEWLRVDLRELHGATSPLGTIRLSGPARRIFDGQVSIEERR